MSKADLLKAYNRERGRIQRQFNRMQKRGYTFEKLPLPPKPKRITEASIKKLQKITTPKLYEKAKYTVPDTGKKIKGLERRKEERSQAAKKAAETRKTKQKRQPKEVYTPPVPVAPSEKELILDQIRDMINDARAIKPRAADHLEDVLNAEITTYGEDAVAESISNAPEEMMQNAEIALRYDPGSNSHDTAIRAILHIITGAIPSAQDLAALQDALDQDDFM